VDRSNKKFVEVAGSRWTVETCFKESKSETGFDQYEVRGYDGWYKHITFSNYKNLYLHNGANSSIL
jgi:SRSO17 transposase